MISTNAGDTRINQNILPTISLSDGLPKSNIVYNNHGENKESNNHLKRYLRIAHALSNKYIKRGAEFQVNLSYGCRRRITQFIYEHNDLSDADSLNETDQLALFILFNEASKELYALLKISHRRYIIGNNGLLIPAAAFSYVGATTAKIVD